MPVRIGVDVGGTFTKAVACDAETGTVLARGVVPTSHAAPRGVAEGVVDALRRAVAGVGEGAGRVVLVAHSTTQAVNALLEGDTAVVGILGIGRRPDLRRARRRTHMGEVRLAPGRSLRTTNEFLDASDGADIGSVREAVERLRRRGAEAVAASEAFGVEDPSGELAAIRAAARLGLPACGGHELTGLYGLEIRTVTAALNASILPKALETARVVEEAVARDAPGVPLLVMRGDGGAADIATMRRRPLLTAFSGPAASVAGALRHLAVRDGVVVEVGGTSTNVSVIKGGRPVLSYVRVLDHVSCVRSLDVRVTGVAGGSLLRLSRRLGRLRITDVGPRSAHIAGLPYACFSDPRDLQGAEPRLSAPRPGDPKGYVVLRTREREVALTLTCAANALGSVPEGTYAAGNSDAARAAFRILGEWLGRDGGEIAREAIELAARRAAAVVQEAIAEYGLRSPVVVGVGGGAGALVPPLADRVGASWEIPPEAEVISSIGDALSLVRAEVERAVSRPGPAEVAAAAREAEEAAVAAGAVPATIQLETQAVPERGALRVVAIGSAALETPAVRGEETATDLDRLAAELLGPGTSELATTGFYAVFVAGNGSRRRFAVLDRRGSVALEGSGLALAGTGDEVAGELRAHLPSMVRRFGPVGVAPAVRVVRGARLIDLSLLSSPDRALEAAVAECRLADGAPVAALVTRS
jgi:N-methylhydantoinase A/oxoprolinase/acetone carboxylase beta subunit